MPGRVVSGLLHFIVCLSQVKLLEPEIKPTDKHSAAKPVRLNSQNNIEWDLTVGQGKTTELVLKYSVEHPSGEEIVELL